MIVKHEKEEDYGLLYRTLLLCTRNSKDWLHVVGRYLVYWVVTDTGITSPVQSTVGVDSLTSVRYRVLTVQWLCLASISSRKGCDTTVVYVYSYDFI